MDWQALALTLRLAVVTTIILLLIAVPLAFWIVSTHSRLRALVEAVTTLPLLLPPTVLGFYMLILMGPRTTIGRAWIHLTGHPLAFSFAGLVTGSVIYSLPFAVQPIATGFSAVDAALIEQAQLLGAGPLRLLGELMLPLSVRSLVTAAVLCFTHTIGEFGVVLMIGGDIPGSTRTLSISIFDQVQDFNYAAANRTALTLITISIVALVALYLLRARGALSTAQGPGNG